MNTEHTLLNKSMQLGSVTIPGRIVKTATAETMATEDGFVTDELLAYYAPMVDAGTPMIISGNLYTSASGKSSYRMTGADDRDKLPGLRRLVDLVHGGSGKIFAQINHCGRQVVPRAMGFAHAVSPSGVTEKLMGIKPRPLDIREIQEIIASFVCAAEICADAGFDGIQLHGGHGYLINQFLTPYTNCRNDEYGGTASKRMRFLLESVRAVRGCIGDSMALIVKMNGSDYLFGRRGLEIEDMCEIARILESEGVDGLEITVGHYESVFPMIRGRFDTYFSGFMQEGFGRQIPMSRRALLTVFGKPAGLILNRVRKHRQGFNLDYAAQIKEQVSIPIICVGGFRTRSVIENAISQGLCDAVSVGRAMIADPYLYKHLLNGEPGPECNFCNGCIARWGSLPIDCYDENVRQEKDRCMAQMKGGIQ